MPITRIKHCTQCGATVSYQMPTTDNRMRAICDQCQHIHYDNPKLVVGCIPEWEDGRILLCRRAIQPKYGLWTLPAGFMENGETTAEAGQRETLEEANATVEVLHLYSLCNLPHANQVYLIFRAKLLNLNFSAGTESLEVELFTEQQIPWNELAFATIHLTLTQYFNDRRQQQYPFHTLTLDRRAEA